jgi:hypothetical protein
MPIARATLEEIGGVSRRSQRAYEERAGIEVQHNFAVGGRVEAAAAQERAWQQGNATFQLKDYHGHQGKKGRTYLAWQLPNSYAGGHEPRPRGRQKRINQRLADLFMQGMTGNGEDLAEQRYYADGKRPEESCALSRDQYWLCCGCEFRYEATHNLRFTLPAPLTFTVFPLVKEIFPDFFLDLSLKLMI